MPKRPYVTATQHELPFSQLSWEQFERLCLRIVQARGYRQIEHLGRSGNEHGRDIVAWDGNARVAVQCKRVRQFTAADGRREIDKLLTLDDSSRPLRVVFIVTCTISSNARDEIRRAWGGNHESCEFVAATELDAGVRANHDILKEFFQIPGVTATGDERESGRAERAREGPDELSLIEANNRDWIVNTRAFPFQRLLQTIEEVEHPAGRLEYGRAFNEAVRKSGAATTVTERNLLRVCEELDSNNLFRLNWKIGRMLARVVGDVIGLHLGMHHQRLIGGFCEPRLETPQGNLLLAEAASEHTAAASAIGAPILRRLLLSKQPQVPWQLLRRWPLVAPAVSDEVALEEIIEVKNTAIRRMLLLTRLQTSRSSSDALKSLLDGMAEGVSGRSADDTDVQLYHAIIVWATLNTSVDVRGSRSLRGPCYRIHELLSVANWRGKEDDIMTNDVVQALELDSIERDLRNADGGYQPHPNERYSEGRYGYTRHYVRWAFRAVPRDQVAALLLRLLHCADEGIRWAVAAEILNWWTLVSDSNAAVNIVLRLVRDQHPWVVREVLQQLATDTLLCQAIGVDRLTRPAEESRSYAEAEGWATYELAAAIRRIGALNTVRQN